MRNSNYFKLKPTNKVYILKNLKNGDIFVSPITPPHFTNKESATYTRDYMQIPEYSVIQTTYNKKTQRYG